jgi:tetratricopeptide (TPR) repeat protein
VPDEEKPLSNLGTVYFELTRYDDAARQFERILKLNANSPDAHYNLGIIRFREGNFVEAQKHFRVIADTYPRYTLAFYHLAVIESETGNAERARYYARKFLAVYAVNDKFRQRAQSIAAAR